MPEKNLKKVGILPCHAMSQNDTSQNDTSQNDTSQNDTSQNKIGFKNALCKNDAKNVTCNLRVSLGLACITTRLKS